MTNYRLCRIDGSYLGVVEFIALDDKAACEIAERTCADHTAELWERDRIVRQFNQAAAEAGT